jgi:hypothetical protein
MSNQAADCHGCLVCLSSKRPLRCADCVNQALREKRQFSAEAQAKCKAAHDALAAALQVMYGTASSYHVASVTLAMHRCKIQLHMHSFVGTHDGQRTC